MKPQLPRSSVDRTLDLVLTDEGLMLINAGSVDYEDGLLLDCDVETFCNRLLEANKYLGQK